MRRALPQWNLLVAWLVALYLLGGLMACEGEVVTTRPSPAKSKPIAKKTNVVETQASDTHENGQARFSGLNPFDRPHFDRLARTLDALGVPLPNGATARFGSLRLRHSAPVRALAFSPTGESLVSVGDDAVLRVWSPETGDELRAPLQAPRALAAVGFVGEHSVLTVDDSCHLALWSLKGNEPLRSLSVGCGHMRQMVTSVRAPARPRTVATETRAAALAGLLAQRLKAPATPVDTGSPAASDARVPATLDASPESGTALPAAEPTLAEAAVPSPPVLTAIAAEQGGILLLQAGVGLTRLPTAAPVISLAFLDKETLVSLEQDGTLRRWQLWNGTNSVLASGLSVAGTQHLATASNGLVAVVDSTLHVWNGRTGVTLAMLEAGPIGAFNHVVFTNDGTGLITTHRDRVKLWDLSNRRLVDEIRVSPDLVADLALSVDGARLALAVGLAVRLVNPATLAPALDIPGHRVPVTSVDVSPDGKLMATAAADGIAALWEAGAVRPKTRFLHPYAISDMGFDTYSARVVTVSPFDGVRIWPVEEPYDPLFHPIVGMRRLAFPGDGSLLLGSADGHIERRAMQSFELKLAFDTNGDVTQLVAAGPRALLGFDEGYVEHWDLSAGAKVQRLNVDDSVPISLSITPDGRWGLTLSRGDAGSRLLQVWDLDTDTEVARLAGTSMTIAQFAPDGEVAWVGDEEGGLALFEVRPLRKRFELFAHRGPVRSLASSWDETKVLSGSDDTTALVWDVSGLRTYVAPVVARPGGNR